MAEKTKILIIGGTGCIGKCIVEASAKRGHPTFALVRESALANPDKAKFVEGFKSSGVTIVPVGTRQIDDQDKLVAAIKEAGNIKRFLPSEFGNNVYWANAVEPAKSAFAKKAKIRHLIEAEGIPHTYVSSNGFAGLFLRTLAQPGAKSPSIDKVVVLGDGNMKMIFNTEIDIGTYTIRAVDDPRTLNKNLYINPPNNIYSFNELVSLWEKKIDKPLERIYVPEEQVLKNIQELQLPAKYILATSYSVFVKGDQSNFAKTPSFEVEALELYPDVKYTTVDEYLNQFV